MLDVSLILKVAGVAICIMFITRILESSGKPDYAMSVNLLGLIVILVVVVLEMNKCLNAIKTMFQI